MDKTNFDTSSTLLVCYPKATLDGEFLTLTPHPLKLPNQVGGTDSVYVIAFNCNLKDELLQLLEKLLKKYETLPPMPYSLNNCLFLEHTIKEIKAGCYEHDVPATLLNLVKHDISNDLQKENLLYLSGVAG